MDLRQLRISTECQRRIDRLCDQAESDWRNGREPDVFQIVDDEWGEALPALLTELIRVELEVSGCSTDDVRASYANRIPEQIALIEKILASMDPDGRSSVSLESEHSDARAEVNPDDFIGRDIGDFTVQELLFVGGFGVVFKAIHRMLRRTVVLKIPKHLQFESAEEIDTFLEEARKAANLNHRNILGIYHVGIDDGLPYIIQEYVADGDLKQLILSRRLDVYKTVKLLSSIVGGVGFAHRSGIIHRDLKPSNILINNLGDPVIADFGLAIQENSGRPGQVAGTVRYMSPEQIRGEADRLDGRSDIWSIGVILYEMLTGIIKDEDQPSVSGSGKTLANLKPVSPDLNAIENPDLRRICSRCLQVEVADRYQSALELEKDLVEFQFHRSEPSFENVVENIPGMVLRYVRHVDGRDEVIYTSNGIRDLFDCEPEEAMKDISKIFGLIDEEDIERLTRLKGESAEKLERFVAEYRVHTPHRGTRWYQCNSQPERLDNGDIVWDGVVLDVTDRISSFHDSGESETGFGLRNSGLPVHLQCVAEQIPGLMLRFVLRADGSETVTFISDGVRQLFAVEPESVLNDASVIWNRIHPDDVSYVRQKVELSAKTLEPFVAEFRINVEGHGVRWCQENARPERLDNGDIAWNSVILDITERKENERALAEAKAGIERIASNMPGMIFQHVVHTDGTEQISFVGPRCRELFEVEPEEAMADAKRLWERVSLDDIDRIQKETQRAFETLEKKQTEFRVVLPEKGTRWLRSITQPSRSEDGTLVSDGVITDITDQKIVELAQEQARLQMDLIVGAVAGMIYRYVERPDGTRKMNYVSPQCAEMFNLEPEVIIEDCNRLFELDHPDDADRVRNAVQLALDRLQYYQQEYRVVVPGRGVRWIHAIGRPTLKEDGSVVLDGVLVDISERKLGLDAH